jgi:hypothetical protein
LTRERAFDQPARGSHPPIAAVRPARELNLPSVPSVDGSAERELVRVLELPTVPHAARNAGGSDAKPAELAAPTVVSILLGARVASLKPWPGRS